MTKVNLGCRNDIREGYINVDLYYQANDQVLKADVRDLPFDDETLDEIIANDILEHIPYTEAVSTLAHWYKKLKPGGRLFVRGPDLTLIIQYASQAKTVVQKEAALRRVFGLPQIMGQAHFWALDSDIMKQYLKSAGFVNEPTITYDYDRNPNDTNIEIEVFK